VRKKRPDAVVRRPSGAEAGEAACRGRRGGGSASPTDKETQSLSNSCSGSSDSVREDRPAAFPRRPSGAEAGEAACRGRRGGGSASPTNKDAQSLSNSCSGSESTACPGWERKIILSVSDDLPGRDARAVERHLVGCERCRTEAVRARRLREACRETARVRPARTIPGLWESVRAGIEARPAGEGRRDPEPLRFPSPSPVRRLAVAASLIAASLLVGSWIFFPVLLDRRADPATVIEARWSSAWEEFVSGSGPRAEAGFDPLPAEIPDPDVIDF